MNEKQKVFQIDFMTPQLYARTYPVSCIIWGNQFSAPNWAGLLVSITELFLAENSPEITQLYDQALKRGRSVNPFIMERKLDGLNCAQLSNGYWININYSIPSLVKLIGELCVHFGISLYDVVIICAQKEDSLLPQLQQLSANCDLLSSHSATTQNDRVKIVCESIIQNYPNGIVFSTTAIRLLSGKLGFSIDEHMQVEIQRQMFKCADGIWFFPDAIADNNSQQQILINAAQWLKRWHFFSISALYESAYSLISDKCDNLDNFESFYNYLASTDPALNNTRTVTWWNMFRVVRTKDISCDTAFSQISGNNLKPLIDNAGGVLSESDLLCEFPALDSGLLTAIIRDYMPWVFKTEIGGLVCFQNEYHMGLSGDFKDRLVAVINKLVEIRIPLSDDNINTALSLELNVNFCEEYNIPDKKTFRRLIERHYIEEPARIWLGGLFVEVPG